MPEITVTFLLSNGASSDRLVAKTVPLFSAAYFCTRDAPSPLVAPMIKTFGIFEVSRYEVEVEVDESTIIPFEDARHLSLRVPVKLRGFVIFTIC